MLYGIMAGDRVMLVASEAEGKPVTETAKPDAPEGYVARMSWSDVGSSITQAWEVVPADGTAAEAALALAQMQAASLSDDDALKVPALYPRWVADHSYAEGDRVTYQGKLYKALRAHLSAANERPCAPRRSTPSCSRQRPSRPPSGWAGSPTPRATAPRSTDRPTSR